MGSFVDCPMSPSLRKGKQQSSYLLNLAKIGYSLTNLSVNYDTVHLQSSFRIQTKFIC